MATCEVCGEAITNPAGSPTIMSSIGPGRIRVQLFCSDECKTSFVTRLKDEGLCAWCGDHIGQEPAHYGGLGEPYCRDTCFDSAGRAMFGFYFR